MPSGVPGPPLLRNRGPVRTLGGQSEPALQMVCYVKYTYLIQYGGRGVYHSITMHAHIFTMYVGRTKVKEMKLKTLNFYDIMFFIHSTKQNASRVVRLTIKTT